MRTRALAALVVFVACAPAQSPAPQSAAATPTPTAAPPPAAATPAAPTAGAPAPPRPVHDVSETPPPAEFVKSEVVPGFMRGINLGNALDAPKEGEWGVTLQPAHFSMAKAAGLDHVRLPVRFSAHAKAEAPYTIDEALFKRVDFAVEEAAKNGLSIIIDLHHYEELMKKPDAHVERLVGLWKQIAERYKKAPATVAFELINEPCDELKPEKLNPIVAKTLAAVRVTNPKRTVIVDGYFWANAEHLKSLTLPEDKNVVASFHNYHPILFTHQGMPWMGPEYQTLGVVFPGPPAAPIAPTAGAQAVDWVKGWFNGYNSQPAATNANGPKAIYDYFKFVDDYVKGSKRRVYMGEFGVADTVDAASRESWLRLTRKEAEKRQIGWALWDDGGKFKARDLSSNSWTPAIQAGLFGEASVAGK